MINFSGTLEVIEVNDGSNIYSGASIGDTFFGSFSYGNSLIDASFSGDGDHQFPSPPFTGSISDGATTIQNLAGEEIEVGIGNNVPLDEDFELVNNLLGTTFDATSEFDVWDIEGMDRDGSTNLEFGISFLFDTSLYSNQDFQVSPPDLLDVDLAYFAIQIIDESDEHTFLGYGKLNSVTTSVPTPPMIWLFCTGIIGLAIFRGYKITI